MNSKGIQQIFPDVYGDLFSQCPIIASAPGDFFWAGEHSVLSGGIGVCQHLPLRCYVGLKPADHRGFKFPSFKYHQPHLNCFKDLNQRIYDFSPMIELLNQEQLQLCPDTTTGYDIYGLAEFPVYCGLNTSGAFSATLAVVFFLAMGKLTKGDLIEWQSTPTSKLPKNLKFEQVFRLAWKIMTTLRSNTQSAIRVFAPLTSSQFPIFCCSAKTEVDKDITKEVGQLTYWGGDLSEITDEKHLLNWPLDILLLYTGDNRPTALSTNNSGGTVRASLETVSKGIQKQLEAISNHRGKQFLQNISVQDILWSNYLNALSTIAIEILHSLQRVFSLYDEDSIANLSRAMRKHNYGLRLLAMTTPWIKELSTAITKYTEDNCRIKAGVKLTGGGKGGDLLIVTPFNDLRDNLPDFLQHLQAIDPAENVSIDYISWEDGFEPRGVTLEQDLHNRLYSPWVAANTYRITHLTPKGELHQSLVSEKESEQIKSNVLMLLDKVEKRIYIGGKKLTSKEIKSSSATIEIIEYLLNKPGRKIKNNELPNSIYALDRNEFQSKIMIPLNKTLKDLSKNHLLELHGGITEFAVGLKPGNEIHVLEKIS